MIDNKTNYKTLNKTLLFGSVLFFCILNTKAQTVEQNLKHSWELGAYLGGSNFKGDIAPNLNFRNTGYSFGTTIKYNLDYFSSLKLIVNNISIHGSDNRINRPFHNDRNESFSANMMEIGALYDYNFIPFTHPKQILNFSPFLVGGFSFLMINSSNGAGVENDKLPPVVLSIPFGGGTRIALNPKWILNFEAIARRTFTDFIDLSSQKYTNGVQKSISTNNDWVYTFQIGLSYTFYRVICPDPVKNI